MRALFIGPKFYGYENEIVKEFNRRGIIVDYFPERSEYLNSLTHFVGKIIPKADRLNSIYENKLWKKISKNSYDYFLLIRGEILTKRFIQKINSNLILANGKTVYYSWDSVLNLPNSKEIMPCFDKCYTFDKNDSIELGISFLPLFYIDNYKQMSPRVQKKWDISIVAAFTPLRYSVVYELNKLGYKIFDSLYLRRYLYYKQIVTNAFYRSVDRKHISHNILSPEEIADIYAQSKAVLDIPSPTQTGLSLRTLECLSSRMKLITTNSDVANYNFYNPNNIFILDPQHIEKAELDSWMDVQYQNIDAEITDSYSIKQWFDTLFKM